jgi:hypothetical protein
MDAIFEAEYEHDWGNDYEDAYIHGPSPLDDIEDYPMPTED